MKKQKKRTEPVKPDVRGATQAMLNTVAMWMTTAGWPALGVSPAAHSAVEWSAFEEARQLAIQYVRLGAKG
jgi:hypothetical protein